MKPLTKWIAPCLVVSIYFTDFARVNAEQTPQGPRKPTRNQVQKPSPATRPAPTPSAAPKQPASSQPNRPTPPARQAPAPPVAKRQLNPEHPQVTPNKTPEVKKAPDPSVATRTAPSPQANQRGEQQAKQAEQAAANRERAAQNVENARENQAARQQAAQDAARSAAQNRENKAQDNAERAQAAQERARENQADAVSKQREAQQDRVADAQKRAQDAQDRGRDAATDRQQTAKDLQERQRQAMQDRTVDAQKRAAEAQDRAREAADNRRENVQDAQERQRQALQDRAAQNQDRVRDAQERLRENQQNQQGRIADNQVRLREAQDRARQAQADLRNRASDNLDQRRQAYNNARQLAAEARRPFLERPELAFRADSTLNARRDVWQRRWSNWGAGYTGSESDAIAQNSRERIALARNYERALNWSYQPESWGARPWWTANRNHEWYTGSWNYGWNRDWHGRHNWYSPQPWAGYSYGGNSIGTGIAWGLAAWGLGNVIYDSGYETYYNPYSPQRYAYGDTVIAYDQPFTEIAANYPTGDEAAAKTAQEKSADALERSRAAFRSEDYMTALKTVDEAISFVPGDSSMHEYRALVLFSLNRYGDAAGVLNSVLASSPGWDYNTMISFYGDPSAYESQIAKLEDYVNGKSSAADARFVLGYHYMVAGNLDGAGRQFDEVVRIQPRDAIAKQLRDLVHSSVKDPDAANSSEPVEGADRGDREVIEPERLVGNWSTDRGQAGTVTLSLEDNGQFRWKFDRESGKDTELSGTYNIDDRGLLVLKSETSQMVGEIHMPQDSQLQFVLAGGPEGDPGLNFTRN